MDVLITAQCGNCEFWDREKIRTSASLLLSDCSSLNKKADSFVDFQKYPMIEYEGFECPVYEERTTCGNSSDT